MLVRGVCSKRSFSNFGFFLQEDFFETNLDLSKHPEQVFSIFSYFLNIFFWRKKIILVFGELRELCAKFWKFWVNIHREIICQSRLLLTPFFNCCIVHCATNRSTIKNHWSQCTMQQLQNGVKSSRLWQIIFLWILTQKFPNFSHSSLDSPKTQIRRY